MFMAIARLRTSSPSLLKTHKFGDISLKRFTATASSTSDDVKESKDISSSDVKEVNTSDSKGSKKTYSWLFPWRKSNKGHLWTRGNDDLHPQIHHEFFPSGLGNALLQATENINRLFANLNIKPSHLMARVKEDENCYKIHCDMPGVTKEDIKITIHDGILTIEGEHKENQEDETGYGFYCNNSINLPDDAEVDEVKAEMKHGVLTVYIPRSGDMPKRDVKEVPIY